MGWTLRLRGLPLRTKVLITIVGGGLALLGASTWLSFSYWKGEALAAAEQQALLAAGAVRASVDASLVDGRSDQARRSLRRLVETAPITHARVYGEGGRILISTDRGEEGGRVRGVWIPAASEVPAGGLVRAAPDDDAVRAFVPLAAPGVALLEVHFSVGPLRAAMDRGARLGIGLLIGSLFALALLLLTMLEREVVSPVERMSALVRGNTPAGRREDELRQIATTVAELMEKEQAVGELAAVQRRQMEAQAGLAQVGEMAAEMAHEFKRPLASIRTALGLMEQEYTLDERSARLLEAVDGQLEKLSETMRDLFALAKPVEPERVPLDACELVDGALAQLAGHPAAERIQVVRRYPSRSPMVVGDAHRLEQGLLNLMLNAAEAMPEGGTLTLGVEGAHGHVRFDVEDTGPGIPPEEVDKVLRPFYSTKPMGTGLGLPLVARVAAAHGGTVEIDSTPGSGTRVTLDLPAASAADLEHQEATWPMHASSS
ncbi:MAG TPA: ATP-binding protein [Longimicrobiales bacterium]|nr:ATP-binding protein [Longimicrobiales bacterium]